MILYQVLLRPENFDMHLWHFTLIHVAYLWNNLPNGLYSLASIEIFTRVKLNHTCFKNVKSWCYPVYYFDPNLQDGKEFPKWNPRTRRGQYIYKTPSHASSLGLIQNIHMGYISPHFHVVYDNGFQTVMRGYDNNEAVDNLS